MAAGYRCTPRPSGAAGGTSTRAHAAGKARVFLRPPVPGHAWCDSDTQDCGIMNPESHDLFRIFTTSLSWLFRKE